MSHKFESISSPQRCKTFRDGVASEMVGSWHLFQNESRRTAG